MGACDAPGDGYGDCRNRVVGQSPARAGMGQTFSAGLRFGSSRGHGGSWGSMVPRLRGTAPVSGPPLAHIGFEK